MLFKEFQLDRGYEKYLKIGRKFSRNDSADNER